MQGLIPLPIGRKGDTDGAADLIPESSEKRRHTVAAVENDHPKGWIHSHTMLETIDLKEKIFGFLDTSPLSARSRNLS